MISIVIPTYNESSTIESTLINLFEIISTGDEVIVGDGFSEDETKEIAGKFTQAKLVTSKRGRALQMNMGAEKAENEYILFLHADTIISATCLTMLKNEIISNRIGWGWFPIKLNSPKFIFRVLELGANMRTSFTGTPLGDHGIFVKKDLFFEVGGFPEMPIMEEIEFVRNVKKIQKELKIYYRFRTSLLRFEKSGVLKTFVTMWILRYYRHIR